jgi:predicted permease
MNLWTRFRSWLRAILRRSRAEREMGAELHFHIEAFADDLIRAGVSREEALRRARVEFGGVERAKEECRDATGANFFDSLLQDIRYGLRVCRKDPGFTAVAVLTLALGIGANTAIFSLIDAVMLRSIPVRDPQNLVVFRWEARNDPNYHGYSSYGDCGRSEGGTGCSFSVPLFDRMREQANVFSGLVAFSGPIQFDVAGNGPASIGRGEVVSGDFFETLGIETMLGRPIGPEDDSISAPPVAVLSYAYWKNNFGSDPSVVGRSLQLNGVPCTIVGVTSANFTRLAPGKAQDLFLPMRSIGQFHLGWLNATAMTDSQNWWIVILGRLKDGSSLQQAQAVATTIFSNEMLHVAKPISKEDDKPTIVLVSAQEGLTGQRNSYSTILYVLMSAVGFVLLIACANVAGLTLARSNARQREMAVRLALGGGRWRIVRQLLTESMMLSLAGGILGTLLAKWGVHALQALFSSSSDRPFPFLVTTDWRVFVFSLSATVLTGLLFGVAPALRGTSLDLTPALQGSASTSQVIAGRGVHLRGGLVVAQVALSILVLVGAGLLVRTLQDLHAIDPGFDTRNILIFEINPSLLGYQDERIQNLYRELRGRFAAIPGVISASYASVPLISGGLSTTELHLLGQPEKTNIDVDSLAIGPDFFSTLRIPLLDGRIFTAADFASAAAASAAEKTARESASQTQALNASPHAPAKAAPVPAIVNDTFVKQYFPKQNPIGLHLDDPVPEEPSSAPRSPGYEIVGVVKSTKYSGLRRDIKPAIYLPLTRGGTDFELRTAIDTAALIPVIRSIVNAVDPNLPIFDVRTQTERIESLISQQRTIARLSSFFGLVALVLACIGLYGLLAYEVTRRTREIGIRVALGAQQGNVVTLVLRQGIVLVVLGCAFGVAAGLGLTRYLRSLLYGVEPLDPLTFVSVVTLLFVVALAACYLPARRASQVDPMIALRHQ